MAATPMTALVKVTAVSAIDLASMDDDGFSDPYLLMMLGDQRKKTKIVKKSLDPHWGETFTFKLPNGPTAIMTLQAWDWDLAKTDDFLGETVIDLKCAAQDRPIVLPLKPQQGKEEEQGYVRGSITIEVEIPGVAASVIISSDKVVIMKQALKACLDNRSPTLDLSTCQLPALPKIVLEKFGFLKKLDLGFNKLAALPDLTPFPTLSELDLKGNQLIELTPSIAACSQTLKVLSLNGNALSSLPAAIGKLVNLEKLEAANNNLTSLPKEIGRLENLVELYLTGNPLEELPPSIGALKNITLLDAGCCRLKSLPDEITLCTRMLELNVSNNALTKLPVNMGKMTRLLSLNIQDNNISELPLSLALCTSLGEANMGINISRNPIADKEMLSRYKIGPDHLLDFLMKRAASQGGVPTLPPVPMPRDLGEGPVPVWVQKEMDEQRAKEQAAAAAGSSQQAELNKKIMALKGWVVATCKDGIRTRLAVMRNDIRNAADVRSLLEITYPIKDLNVELEKIRGLVPFESGQPRMMEQDSPQVEVLRALAMAAVGYLDNATRAIQNAIIAPSFNDLPKVVVLVQTVNLLKTIIVT